MTTITNNELTDDVLEYVLAVVEDRYENRKSNAGEDDRIILALRELQKRRKASKEPVRYLNKFSGVCVTLEQQPNASDDVAVYMPLYAAPPASERERIRREHAEWSDKTFGDVGPVGPLKHLSKEALETAAEPDDLSEWADMQFLLWDAQRRAGISDEQITLAMVEKLAVNKKREWPEPKDGEPRLHIKEQPVPAVPDEWTIQDAVKFCRETGRQDAGSAMEGWNACRAAMLQGVEPVSQTYKLNELSGNSPVTPNGWISCSEQMPEDEQEVIVHNKLGYRYVSYFDEHSGLFFDMRGGNQMNCIEHLLVTHWRPMPAPPQQ
ncbi:TPA: dATP/dGTP pyrophosphohydrolase domain-containing protein [Salmonella enterica subsp. enterica serovar Muenchen]